MTAPVEPPPEEFGKYRLRRKLAQGGMAEIFLADLEAHDEPVVIKRVLPALCTSDDFVQMFLDEARIAARLDHSNLVRIFDLGEVGGQYYVAMEYVAGEDQSAVMRYLRRERQQVPLEYAAEVVIGAAEALMFAHSMVDPEGRPMLLVHRDVSPSNILFTWDGGVKLVDFGIARAESNVARTQDGRVKGKIPYLSPEQCSGGRADRRSDLFSLGIVFYELVTCTRLFLRDSALATLEAITKGQIPKLATMRTGVPVELERVMMRALEIDPDARYQTAAELAADLSVWLGSKKWRRGADSVDFLSGLFGAPRRQAKLALARGERVDAAALDAATLEPQGELDVLLGPSVNGPDDDDRGAKTAPLVRLGLSSGLLDAHEDQAGARTRPEGRRALAAAPISAPATITIEARRDEDADGDELKTVPVGDLSSLLRGAAPRRSPSSSQASPVAPAPLSAHPLDGGEATEAVTIAQPRGLQADDSARQSAMARAVLWVALAVSLTVTVGVIALVLSGRLGSDSATVATAQPIRPSPLPPAPAPPPPSVAATPPPVAVAEPSPPVQAQNTAPGRLRFTGLPARARVLVDGVSMAKPLAGALFSPGPHAVVVTARGYLKFERAVEVAPGEAQVVKVQLRRAGGKRR